MHALVWHGKDDIPYDTVTDSEIEDDCDAIIGMTRCAIWLGPASVPQSHPPDAPGDIMGPELMGEVIEVARARATYRVRSTRMQ